MSEDKTVWPTVDDANPAGSDSVADEAFDGDTIAAPDNEGGAKDGEGETEAQAAGEGDLVGLDALVGADEGADEEDWENELDNNESRSRSKLRKLDYSDRDVDPRAAPEKTQPPAPDGGAEPAGNGSPPPGAASAMSGAKPEQPERPAAPPSDPATATFPGDEGDDVSARPPTRQSFASAYETRVAGMEKPQTDAEDENNAGGEKEPPGNDAAPDPGNEAANEDEAQTAAPGANGETASAGVEDPADGKGDEEDDEVIDEYEEDAEATGMLGGLTARLGDNARKWIRIGAMGAGGAGALAFAATMVVKSFPGQDAAAQAGQATEAAFAAPQLQADPFAGLPQPTPEPPALAGGAAPGDLFASPAPAQAPTRAAGGNLFASPAASPADPDPAAGDVLASPGTEPPETVDEFGNINPAVLEAALMKVLSNGNASAPATESGIGAEALEALRSDLQTISAGVAALRLETQERFAVLESRQEALAQTQADIEAESAAVAQGLALAGNGAVPRGSAPECDAYQRNFLSSLGQPLQAAILGNASGRRWVRLVSPLLQRSVLPGDALPAGGRDAVVQIDDEGAYIEVRRPGNSDGPCVVPLGA